eukprot:CAMPEP_0204217958 /NCGR_PEP_ID=MMETSP0361-20130328/79259_1 /ASSEMBLY_ACC=CAM_ASM_000343 /TAXON_ID=268821 /ORGANISM="Scrippsiella Hangoei, Strain SHTV-5" /LENGTH=147 /DNA_ID=CAMNT_0051183025 /DNA_START=21 /DNA_END=462 /DNA_ORIENTATION=-
MAPRKNSSTAVAAVAWARAAVAGARAVAGAGAVVTAGRRGRDALLEPVTWQYGSGKPPVQERVSVISQSESLGSMNVWSLHGSVVDGAFCPWHNTTAPLWQYLPLPDVAPPFRQNGSSQCTRSMPEPPFKHQLIFPLCDSQVTVPAW